MVNLKEEGSTLIYLTPITFIGMLRIPRPTKIFKVLDANAFLGSNGNGVSILKNFLIHMTT